MSLVIRYMSPTRADAAATMDSDKGCHHLHPLLVAKTAFRIAIADPNNTATQAVSTGAFQAEINNAMANATLVGTHTA